MQLNLLISRAIICKKHDFDLFDYVGFSLSTAEMAGE